MQTDLSVLYLHSSFQSISFTSVFLDLPYLFKLRKSIGLCLASSPLCCNLHTLIKEVSCPNHRAHLFCFRFLMYHCPLLPNVQWCKTIVSYITFQCFIVWGERVNLVPLTSSLDKAEVCILILHTIIKTEVPKLLGTRDQFCGGQVFHWPGDGGNGFGMIHAHYIYCVFICIIVT